MMTEQRVAESISRTATEIFPIEPNNVEDAQIIVDITAGASGTDTIVVTIDGYDQASRKWYNILTSAALDAVGTTVLRIGISYFSAVNVSANDFMPRKTRIVATKNNATPITYSIGLNGRA